MNRRRFLKNSIAVGASVLTAPAILTARSPHSLLNLGVIGVAGRGGENLEAMAGENIVALCDVDRNHLAEARERFPRARTFRDFRRMLENPSDLDGVVVSTPDHTHFFAVLAALRHGLHVYCEKPLTYSIEESRKVARVAKESGAVTQMGIQIHSGANYRRVVELVRSGAVGPVSEVHVWVSRAWGDGERPRGDHPVPDHLDWELWLGPAPFRPYHPDYLPGPAWYKYWDFAGGTLSDLGSHWNDLPFWALDLGYPLSVEASGPPPNPETAPASMQATYEFGPRGEMPAVTLNWYQGERKPRLLTEGRIPPWSSGVLFVGSQGMLLSDYRNHLLLPEEDFRDFEPPEPFLPESPGHQAEWIAACKDGRPASCDFQYSARLTEANLLGNIAFRLGKKLHWEAESVRAVDVPEADAFVRREYRPGWLL